MNYLLDTHTFLGASMSPEKLSHMAQMIILDVANDIYVSVVTFWEVSLKFALGKIELQGITPADLPDAVAQMGFILLALAPQDAATFHQLPRLQHKDPFDRMLVWQAIRQNVTLLSKDPELRQYHTHGLRVVW
jgi:PIN domain nuclease of toxin-antitoxin system